MIELAGYSVLEKIYAGTRTQVYRGVRLCDRQPIILKILNQECPSFRELVQFRNQYIIAKPLETPGIIKPIALEPYGNSYAIVLEDKGCISLKKYSADRPLNLADFLAIGIQIVTTAIDLHRHRIIHKDIKPQNILINPTTKQVFLIDFSIASQLPRETQELKNPNILEGTLAYMSPEQTGRTSRGIDYRTDFYSLGVTFYELLTGKLPFSATDPMECLHCHLATEPIPPHHLNSQIPEILSRLILKLMAKTPEERYQSAYGIRADLEKIEGEWRDRGEVSSFPLAQKDIGDRFTIPDKLYGRNREVEQLLAAFHRVSTGDSEMMLVSGFSGIGKTALVAQVHKPILRHRGYFIKGKFDQFNRDIPFRAFVQAFSDLVRQLLGESAADIATWKAKILTALGDRAAVIIDAIPELELLLGTQPPVPELDATAAQNRFNLLFQKFIRVFPSADRPLVIFLDDLQWADSASLKLIQLLMNDTQLGHLLCIGAYRDNEVSAAHPLMLTLENISKTEAHVEQIVLKPLEFTALNQFVSDTLSCPGDRAVPLTRLIQQKTQGNPFFAAQFLKSLHEEGLIVFNSDRGSWQCDISGVKALSLTDDVVEFMALQLRKLPKKTQTVLKLAACIGNIFDLETLAIVYQKPRSETAADLWSALQEGLVVPTNELYKFFTLEDTETSLQHSPETADYKFLHDRVQQAAYFLIPPDKKQVTHLKIGQRLWQNTPPERLEENIFEIVNQLNYGIESIQDASQREEIAALNAIAGRKAQASTAYAAAFAYFSFGIKLLNDRPWQHQYELTLELHERAAETAFLSGNFVQQEKLTATVLQQAKTLLDKVKTYEIAIAACMAQCKQLEALEIARQVLTLLDVTFPESPTYAEIQQEFARTKSHWQQAQQIQQLIHLPKMSDPYQLAKLRILASIFTTIFQVAPQLLPLIILKQVNLSIEGGNAPLSAFAYASYGLLLCGVILDIEAGYHFGKLALNLLEKFDAKALRSKVVMVVYSNIWHWKASIRDTLAPFLDAYASGLETGDLEYAAISAHVYSYHLYFSSAQLPRVEAEMAKYCEAIAKIEQENILNYNRIYHQTVLNLVGRAENRCRLTGSAYNEEIMLPLHEAGNDKTAVFYVNFHKLYLAYLFGEIDEAIVYAEMADRHVDGVTALLVVPFFYFYDSLAQLEFAAGSPQPQQETRLQKVAKNQEKMSLWADSAPMNHGHKFYLVEAERYRVLGKQTKAMQMYDRAIFLAEENEYLAEVALANELAAKFYLAWGKAKIARVYLTDAYYAYARWGAIAKIEQLESRYPDLLAPILAQKNTLTASESASTNTIAALSAHLTTGTVTDATTSSVSSMLDISTAIKASQALSEEIQLDRLLSELITIAMQNAGATKCALVLPQGDTLAIEAFGVNGKECSVLQSLPLQECDEIPATAIEYVSRTGETLLLNDATTETILAADAYMMQHQPKSILCAPLQNSGKTIAILYLENHLTRGAFTRDRLALIHILTSQAAISLENARLYRDLQHSVQQKTDLLASLQNAQLQLVQNEKMSSLGQLAAGVGHEINNPLSFIAGNINLANEYIQDLLEHLRLYQQQFPDGDEKINHHAEAIDLEYLIEDLPELIASMKTGTDRIRLLSQSLRTFSRADTDTKVEFNIHEGIDSTLLILKHRLKANPNRPAIEVVKHYGELPSVKCYPGQLNQAFMNLLANAIDALDEANRERSFDDIKRDPNIISIYTKVDPAGEFVQIRIADNGPGMPEEIKHRVFDHLFTTKPPGKGTGLGLSISRQIVESKHGGQLRCISSPDRGSEFIIEIPL
ncbi:trifunctional serine/threonine-protein kinase/ATP-binding protein/sensor histidine kinase [Phormidium sp. CCY1219]|uniref:trifunctional serine/threonine-protein kinase/ATP-binding protein/sensor histidine kinase n=1 Tax=Phormidium sp. CCY1219 TaxID=2886104 RepID=UPI002D1F44BC|nr:AAA family ATPase [Phormidium sp. CCY1219]MEB3825882.1 trifunctional serine/threonine-protein kinase/ATP-binding protein/sensor histidine kinase [Phormidium sp. CCY1219]